MWDLLEFIGNVLGWIAELFFDLLDLLPNRKDDPVDDDREPKNRFERAINN